MFHTILDFFIVLYFYQIRLKQLRRICR